MQTRRIYANEEDYANNANLYKRDEFRQIRRIYANEANLCKRDEFMQMRRIYANETNLCK